MADNSPVLYHTATAEDRDLLIKYLRGDDVKLTEKQLEMYNRISCADDLIRNWGRTDARKQIQKKFEVAERTARLIVSDALMIFGSTFRKEKEYYRQAAVDNLMKTASGLSQELFGEDDQGNPKKINDPKLAKALVEVYSELRRTLGYDKDSDFEQPDWEKIGANPIHLTTSPEDAGFEPAKNIKQLEAEIKKMMEKATIEDVDFTEVEDEQ